MERLLQWLIRLGVGLVMVATLAAGAQETESEAEGANQENWVSGQVKAMEHDSNSVVVDGRRLHFGNDVRYDGVVLEREEALDRLSVGDSVQIEHEQDYQNTIRSIHTRQR